MTGHPNEHLDFNVDTIGVPPLREVVFSIGANLGDRMASIQGAVDALSRTPQLRLTAVSSVYETEPVGSVLDQPAFLNIIAIADTSLRSLVLLERAQAIENAFKRVREVPGGPRTLDVDLVAVGERVKHSLPLTLPHPRAHQRAFVLVPWLEVDPDATIPGQGRVADLVAGLDTSGVVRLPGERIELG